MSDDVTSHSNNTTVTHVARMVAHAAYEKKCSKETGKESETEPFNARDNKVSKALILCTAIAIFTQRLKPLYIVTNNVKRRA